MTKKHTETPPYVPKKGLIEVLEVIALHKKGDVITRDELHKRGVSSHLIYPAMAALKFLGLLDESGMLTGGHEAFSKVSPDVNKQREIIERSYSDFFENVKLPLSSEEEAEKKFQEVYGVSERLMKSSFPLFYYLAKEAGIEIIKVREKFYENKEQEKATLQIENDSVEKEKTTEGLDIKVEETNVRSKTAIQFVVSIQVNKFTTEKDIVKMIKTAKKAIHLLKKTDDA